MRSALLALLLIVLLVAPGSSLSAGDTVASVAAPFRYRLASWETHALLEKGFAGIRQQFSPGLVAQPDDSGLVRRYFDLAERVDAARGRLERAAAAREGAGGIEGELAALEREQVGLEDAVERALAAQVSAALRREGLGRGPGGRILFPPVLMEFDPLPAVLAVSPRERIELQESRLLQAGLSLAARERLEGQHERLLLSSLVVDIGGLATYPSLVPNTYGLPFALATVAHEWLHQYLTFQPLGKGYFAGGEMTTLNETVATLFGDELGARLYHELYGGSTPPPLAQEPGSPPADPRGFDFTREMRQTRVRMEELLREGQIAEAEQYMEQRRQFLLSQGYYLRKLNQAYFAFHGSYAEGPAAVSPLGGQVRLLRARSASLGEFIRTAERFGRAEEFQAYLAAP
ncbi:MAG: hypothetical protein EXR60_03595 [Dehalococcoidia bacterium]|nr:hypothetical protein [Dehalococcoidia bacterium]